MLSQEQKAKIELIFAHDYNCKEYLVAQCIFGFIFIAAHYLDMDFLYPLLVYAIGTPVLLLAACFFEVNSRLNKIELLGPI